MDVFIGIDVACAKRKYLPLVICGIEGERLVPFPLAEFALASFSEALLLSSDSASASFEAGSLVFSANQAECFGSIELFLFRVFA